MVEKIKFYMVNELLGNICMFNYNYQKVYLSTFVSKRGKVLLE